MVTLAACPSDITITATTLAGPSAAAGLASWKARLVGAVFRCEVVSAIGWAVADGGAFLVGGEEGGLVDAGPEGFAFDGEGFDGVEVGTEFESTFDGVSAG